MIFEAASNSPAAPAKVVPASAAQSLPSTRAGGQDDGSNKLPQMKLYFSGVPNQGPCGTQGHVGASHVGPRAMWGLGPWIRSLVGPRAMWDL